MIQEAVSSKRTKLRGRATSHFNALEKIFPTNIRFLILLGFKAKNQPTQNMMLKEKIAYFFPAMVVGEKMEGGGGNEQIFSEWPEILRRVS